MNNLSSTTIVENIWNDFSKPLKGFIINHINNTQDVDDILQNVFYKIHNNISSLKDSDKIYAWVYKIAKNTITDFYRAQKYESYFTELPEEIIIDTQHEITANDEIAQCLKAIYYLPEKYKCAIILTEFQNLTQKELGSKMGLSLSGAKSRVQRARAKLKEMLLDCCSLEFDHFGNVIDYNQKNKDCKYC
jgi:RNA polymerase sigma-70 factor (ECF subfamily)